MDLNHLTIQEHQIIRQICRETNRNNIDNISRTDAYFEFFRRHPEITWSFLASMVSRNGGYNMCDLEGSLFPQLIDSRSRKQLFLTYERANWLIFHDIYPQLLIYEYSTKINKEMFHLLPFFHVSAFIKNEWRRFWKVNDQKRLMIALIINEQNVIQCPIIEHPIYRSKVFNSWRFLFQDWLHFSSVVFPTCGGELYGASVNGFRKLDKRINLGKRLASILFNRRLFPYLFEFAVKTTHTGSRNDYEKYFKYAVRRETPFLRTTFPIIDHHRHEYSDWSKDREVPLRWLKSHSSQNHPIHLTDWYIDKLEQLQLLVAVKKFSNSKKA
jgi:hypothetical protein